MTDELLSRASPPPVPVLAQRHMFTADSRKALLRQVVRLQPYKNPALWDAVTHAYSWWCYDHISPARRSVPKDRLRKKVKSIICVYTGVKPEEPHGGLPPDDDSSTSHYDAETLSLIEQVVKQYTESMELQESRRSSRKRESDIGSARGSKSPSLSAAVRFRAPITPSSDMFQTDMGYSLNELKRFADDEETANGASKHRRVRREAALTAETVAAAATHALVQKLPEVLEATRAAVAEDEDEDLPGKARVEALGGALGAAFAASFSSAFETAFAPVIDRALARIDDVAKRDT